MFSSPSKQALSWRLSNHRIYDGGRELKLIVYEKRKGLIRVITGWDYDD